MFFIFNKQKIKEQHYIVKYVLKVKISFSGIKLNLYLNEFNQLTTELAKAKIFDTYTDAEYCLSRLNNYSTILKIKEIIVK
jgi:hypothetical protein